MSFETVTIGPALAKAFYWCASCQRGFRLSVESEPARVQKCRRCKRMADYAGCLTRQGKLVEFQPVSYRQQELIEAGT